jgi:hypothetical protein
VSWIDLPSTGGDEMGATRKAASLIGGLVLATALPTGPAGASKSDGLHACDYQSDYDGIACHEVDRAISEIVRCESRFDPRADSGEYKGLFQQVAKYWRKRVADFNRHHNPDVGDNIYSPFDNARVSARMLAAGMEEHWPNCA